MIRFRSLLASFSPVAIAAEHLAVLYDSPPTVAPRGDVVALHELHVKLLATEGADVVLSFPDCHFNVIGEGAQVEVVPSF